MKDLKDYREKELKNYVIGNILILLYCTGKMQEIFLWGSNNEFNIWGSVIESALLISIVYTYVFVFDSIISGQTKFMLCYFGKEKQPGFTIFTDMKKEVKDDRFTKEEVLKKYKKIYDEMPEVDNGKYQNIQWFHIYNTYKEDSKIYTSNRDYILCRDLHIITIWLFVIYLLAVYVINAVSFSWRFIGVLLIEYILTKIAVCVKGKRLVYNVISVDVKKE